MTQLDPALTPPLGRLPPIPDAYYTLLAGRWGVASERVAPPGVHFHISHTIEHALAPPYRCLMAAWRSGQSRWLVSSPRWAECARRAWETCIDRSSGWPLGLNRLIRAETNRGRECDDGWVLLIWPQTLRPVPDPLLAKRVERLRWRDFGRLGGRGSAETPPDRVDALRRGEMWAIFDPAGRQVLSRLWTRAWTDRVRSIGLGTAEEHRNRGLAKALLAAATRDLLAEGFLPAYGVRTTNHASQRVALAVGYRPIARDLLLLERA